MASQAVQRPVLEPPGTWGAGADQFARALGSPWYRLVAGLQDTFTRATFDYAHLRGLRALHFPITTRTVTCPSGLGSDAAPVRVAVNGVDTYLADSMQFMLEYGCRLFEDGCHCILPSFRADRADTSHLGQFVHAEAEIPGDLDALIDYVTGYIRHLAIAILDQHEGDLMGLRGSCAHLPAATGPEAFSRIDFGEAVQLLDANPRYVTRSHGARLLTRAGEQRLIELLGPFVWVTHFDSLAVPFYHACCPEDPSKAINADLLFGMGEIVGAGQRHRDGGEVRAGLAVRGVAESDYDWYCRMKDRWPMLTCGFGLGVDRFLLWVLDHGDIRDLPLVSRIDETKAWPAAVDRP
jgi:asparaginyl-tRNA synthetase